MSGGESAELLAAEGLTVRYASRGGRQEVAAVIDASVRIGRADAVGIVGESGAGKTSLARCLAGLEAPSEGTVRYRGQVVGAPGEKVRMPRVRGVQVVFQDPGASLNPRRRVESVLREVLHVHRMCAPADEPARVAQLLAEVGLSSEFGARRPGRLSGGQQQRAAIARALAFEPDVLIADEAVSSLDASVQAQILNLLARLRSDRGLAIVLISHDTAVVRQLCDHVLVMYRGRVVEEGPTEKVFAQPADPYTRTLLAAVPRWDRQLATEAAPALSSR